MTDEQPTLPPSPVKRPQPIDWDAKAQAWGYPAGAVNDAAAPAPIEGPALTGYDAYHSQEDCPGSFRVIDQSEAIWEAACDHCQAVIGVSARSMDSRVYRELREQRAGFPPRFVGAHFEETADNRPALKAVRGWVADYGSYLPGRRAWDKLPVAEQQRTPLPMFPLAPAVYGTAGRGKSHMLVAVCQQLIREHDATVMFRSVARLLDELQDGFDKQGEYARIWEQTLTVELLALDDVGAQQLTEWRTDRLARLVDERWERMRPVMIATNYRPEDWERVMDERTRSRLVGMTFPVELRGVDRRQTQFAGGGWRW